MARLKTEASGCYSWSNGPGDRYAAHNHSYEKVLYCVDGSITFVLESAGGAMEEIENATPEPAGAPVLEVEPISIDEILDLHLYLKSFQGTLTELIQQPDPSPG